MKYDVVIPLADNPSVYDDLELQFCLRSIEMYYPVRDVWVVTKNPRPNFSVNYIIESDRYKTRYENTRQKILRACENPDVTDPFLLMNDDMYLTAPLDPIPPLWYSGTIAERLKWSNTYHNHMRKSAEYSKDGLNYSLHVPIMIDKSTWINRTRPDCLSRNVYASFAPFKREPLRGDVKLYDRTDHEKVGTLLNQPPCVSTSDLSFRASVLKKFYAKYPNPSRWE